MHNAEFEKFELEPYRSTIEAVEHRCTNGTVCDADTQSHFGGFPMVDSGFEWPQKNGYPLSFVGQLLCSDIPFIPTNTGRLLFFYDNRHWGYSKRDLGHAVVHHQNGDRQLSIEDLPTRQVNVWFGLATRSVRPKIYQRVGVTFSEGLSYPSLERNSLTFPNDGSAEAYDEFCCSVVADIQIGGYPRPVQSDNMEGKSAEMMCFGEPDEWLLLLQLSEVGDMMWGDAGVLYWLIHKEDLQSLRFDRVWVINQCC